MKGMVQLLLDFCVNSNSVEKENRRRIKKWDFPKRLLKLRLRLIMFKSQVFFKFAIKKIIFFYFLFSCFSGFILTKNKQKKKNRKPKFLTFLFINLKETSQKVGTKPLNPLGLAKQGSLYLDLQIKKQNKGKVQGAQVGLLLKKVYFVYLH